MDFNEIVDRITRDVVETLKKQDKTGVIVSAPTPNMPFSSGDRVLIIAEEPLEIIEWQKVINSFEKAEIDVLNLSSSQVPPSLPVKSVIHNAESLKSANCPYGKICYVAVSFYQLSAIANLMDNFKGIKVFLSLASSSSRPCCINLVRGGFFEKSMRELLQAIEAKGISLNGTLSALTAYSPGVSKSSASSACAASSGECSGCGQCSSLIPEKVGAVVKAGAERVSASSGTVYNKELAAQIDHTLLKADATRDEVVKLCSEAREYNFASVCVNPGFVKLASECLAGSPVKVCTVIGFPLGATTSVTKAMETRDAIANGASEIDMVINVGALKAGSYDVVQKDIEAVVGASSGNIVKVILETALLTDEEKVIACKLSQKAGADFVKTSTGFGPGGATAKDVALMRETVGAYMGVKASGGIRDLSTAEEMIKAGATRIGASASVAIVKNQKSNSTY